VEPKPDSYGTPWRTAHGDLTDEEWELIADLVATYSGEGRMGQPAVHDKRDVVNAIFDVAATGCQWRAPDVRPALNTVHRSHLRWSRDGTWTRICDRRRRLGRRQTAGMRRPRPAASMPRASGSIDGHLVERGDEAGKTVSGRTTFGVDTLGLLVAVVVVVASMSDDVGGIAAVDRARPTSTRPSKISCDTGFTRAFASHCGAHHISAEWRGRSTPGPSRCSAGAQWGSGRGPR
jgi:transposase